MRHLDFTLSLIDKLTRPVKQAQTSLTGFADKSKAAFSQIAVGAGAMWAVAQSIHGVLGPAYEMKAALNNVGAKGVAEDTLKRLSAEAQKFAIRYGQNAVDVVNSSYAMKGAMAGLADNDLPRVTIAANTLAAGVKASGEEAGEYMGKMAARFSTELESLGHVRFAEELAGKTAYMVQNFGVSMQNMQELIEGTKNAGADFGVSMNEQFAVLGELSRTMGTESSGMYEQFLRSAPAAAQKLGMSFVDATGKILPMGDILQKIQAKFGKNIAGNVKAQQKLDEAFGGGSDVIKKLVDRQDQLNKSMTELGRNDGMKRAQEMAERMVEPWNRVRAVWNAMYVAIGNQLLPVITPFSDRITAVGTKLVRWLEIFPNIARWVGYITLGILSFGAAGAAVNIMMGVFSFTVMGLKAIMFGLLVPFKGLLWVLNLLRPSLLMTRIGLAGLWIQSRLLAVWTGVCRVAMFLWNGALKAGALAMRIYGVATLFAGVAMQILTSPITLIIAAFALLAVGIWYVVTHWEQLKTALMDSAAFKWVMKVVRQVGQYFSDVWESITLGWAMVVNFFSTMSPLAAFEGFADTIGGVFIYLSGMLSNVWGSVMREWEAVVNFFSTMSPLAAFEGFADTISGVFNRLFDVLKSTFAASYNWIVEKLNKIPGVNIDLKPTAAPVSSIAAPVTGGQSLLAGGTVGDSIPRQGLMSQISNERKTTIDQRRTYGDVHFVMPNGMTPAQLAEWQEMNAG